MTRTVITYRVTARITGREDITHDVSELHKADEYFSELSQTGRYDSVDVAVIVQTISEKRILTRQWSKR